MAQGPKTLVSTNGTAWEIVAERGGTALTYGNGRFLSSDLTASTSLDGRTWTPAHNGPSFEDVAAGIGVFLGVHTRRNGDAFLPRIWASTNGQDWDQNPAGVTNNLPRISFAGDRFFATGDDGNLLVSTNGLDWRILSNWDDVNLNALAEGNGRRVAVGDGGRVLVSKASGPWQVVSSGLTTSLRAVAFGAGRFVAMDSTQLYSSTDGETWTLAFAQPNRLRDVSFGNGRFVVVGGGVTVLVSTNGLTWEYSNLLATSGSGEGELPVRDLYSVSYSSRGFLVAASSYLASSPEGTDWSVSSIGVSAEQAAFGNDVYVVVGSGRIFHSADRQVWTQALAAPGVRIHSLTFGGGLFLLGGSDGSIYTSPDGDLWTRRYTGCENGLRQVRFTADNSYLAVGNNGAILESFPAPPRLTVRGLTPGAIQVTLAGIPGTTGILQTSSSLEGSDWGEVLSFRFSTTPREVALDATGGKAFFRLIQK